MPIAWLDFSSEQRDHVLDALALLQRNFTLTAPNQVWTGDITYIVTDDGLLVSDRYKSHQA